MEERKLTKRNNDVTDEWEGRPWKGCLNNVLGVYRTERER